MNQERILELSHGRRGLFIGCTYVPQFIHKEVGREYLSFLAAIDKRKYDR